MNPSGIVFGPNAILNVGGSVTFTTANYLRLMEINGTVGVFHADSSSSSILTSAPVTAFGFLGSNPAAIAVQGTTLSAQTGQAISLVGGNKEFTYTNPDAHVAASIPGAVSITGGTLTAMSGEINMVSVSSSGMVSAVDFMPASGMTMGNIALSQRAMLNVSDNSAGTVRIRGGQLIINDSTISADTVNASGAITAVEILLTGDLSITNDLTPTITAVTSGAGNSGKILIQSTKLMAASNAQDFTLALIDTHTSGTGKAGDISIRTGDLQSPAGKPIWLTDSGTQGPGNGGDVTISAKNIILGQTQISTGDFRSRNLPVEQDVTGSGGNLRVTADSLDMTGATIFSSSFGGGGDITLEVGDIQIRQGSAMGVSGLKGSGAFTVNAKRFVMDGAQPIDADTAFVAGKPLTVIAEIVELRNGSAIRSHTAGNADAADIVVTATDHITLSDTRVSGRPSGFYTSSVGIEDVELDTLGGRAGSVILEAPRLAMTGGARIDTSTETSGRGGDVDIKATSISMLGERTLPVPEDEFDIASSRSSGIFSRSVGSQFCFGSCGAGGNISLTAGQSVTIQDGASVSASSTGPGNAGNVEINAGQQLDVLTGSITTQATKASGGNIDIRAIDRVRLVNSSISTSVLAEDGTGGNIFIDPNVVILEGSEVTARAVTGAGGNITFVTPLFLADSASIISASSEFGPEGKVTARSNLVAMIPQLESKATAPQVLLQNRCIALAGGEQSTFILSGRDALPSEPGGWLSSPVAMEHWTGEETEEHMTGLMVRNYGWNNQPLLVMSKDETTGLSLRRLTPPGFLVRSFAVSAATGCSS